METVSWSSVSDNDDGILTTMPQWKVETSAPSPTKVLVDYGFNCLAFWVTKANSVDLGFTWGASSPHRLWAGSWSLFRIRTTGRTQGVHAQTGKVGVFFGLIFSRRVTGSERSIASQSPLNSRFILLPLNIPQVCMLYIVTLKGTSHTVVSADLRAPEFSSTFKADLDSTNVGHASPQRRVLTLFRRCSRSSNLQVPSTSHCRPSHRSDRLARLTGLLTYQVTVHPVPFATEGGISRIHSEWSESCCGKRVLILKFLF